MKPDASSFVQCSIRRATVWAGRARHPGGEGSHFEGRARHGRYARGVFLARRSFTRAMSTTILW
jgi:hypothetical protein